MSLSGDQVVLYFSGSVELNSQRVRLSPAKKSNPLRANDIEEQITTFLLKQLTNATKMWLNSKTYVF